MMAYRDVLYLRNILYLNGGMMVNDDDDVDMINLNTVKELQAAIAERDTTIARLRAENAYLAYFHREADFGPAHAGVVMAIQAQYAIDKGVPVPEDWRYE